MTVKYRVEYGKDVYEQAGLEFSDLLTLGTLLQAKSAGLIATASAVMADKAVVSGEVLSFYKTIQEVFTPDEWKMILETILLNERNTLIVNGNALTTEEVEEHFRGDFLKAYSVGIKLALKNLGEFAPFMSNLGTSAKSIVDSLSKQVMEKLETIEQELKKSNAKSKK